MSSHHFVKEGQEPALIIHDPVSHSRIAPVLEWAPLILVCDHALNEVLTWGIKVDVVLAKSDSIAYWREIVFDHVPVKILSYDSDHDHLDTAFYFLLGLRQPAVNILAKDSPALMDKLSAFADRLSISLLTDSMRWLAVRNGTYEKWYAAGSEVFIRPDSAAVASNGGNASGRPITTHQDGMLKLFSQKLFWVGEAI